MRRKCQNHCDWLHRRHVKHFLIRPQLIRLISYPKISSGSIAEELNNKYKESVACKVGNRSERLARLNAMRNSICSLATLAFCLLSTVLCLPSYDIESLVRPNTPENCKSLHAELILGILIWQWMLNADCNLQWSGCVIWEKTISPRNWVASIRVTSSSRPSSRDSLDVEEPDS